jgi:hypothetical protein
MYKISEEQLIVIIRYLMSKPMAEVEQLVAMLRKLEKVDGKPI